MDVTLAPNPVPGLRVHADGRVLVVPAIKLGKLKAMARDGTQAKLDGALASGAVDAETWTLVGDLVLGVLRRNYPAITSEDVDELIDTRNLPEFMRALKGDGEASIGGPSPGEAERPSAPSTTERSTG